MTIWSHILNTLADNPAAGYLTSAYAICASILGFTTSQMDVAIQLLTIVSLLVGIIVGSLTAAVQWQKIRRGK